MEITLRARLGEDQLFRLCVHQALLSLVSDIYNEGETVENHQKKMEMSRRVLTDDLRMATKIARVCASHSAVNNHVSATFDSGTGALSFEIADETAFKNGVFAVWTAVDTF